MSKILVSAELLQQECQQLRGLASACKLIEITNAQELQQQLWQSQRHLTFVAQKNLSLKSSQASTLTRDVIRPPKWHYTLVRSITSSLHLLSQQGNDPPNGNSKAETTTSVQVDSKTEDGPEAPSLENSQVLQSDHQQSSDSVQDAAFTASVDTSTDDSSEGNAPNSSNASQGGTENYKLSLMGAAMKHVTSLGWTRAALEAGAKDLGLSYAAAGLAVHGEQDLVLHFHRQCNAKLKKELEEISAELAAKTLHERLTEGLSRRLLLISPYIQTWPRAMALSIHPSVVAESLQLRSETIDDIWYFAGDRSVDFNWYTKRAVLGAIYSAAEVYMLTDYSQSFQDTQAMIQARIKQADQLGSSVAEVEKIGSFVQDSFTVGLRQWMDIFNRKSPTQ